MSEFRLLLLDVYEKLPLGMKIGIGNIINLLPSKLLYGKTFSNTLNEIYRTEFYSQEQIDKYLLNKVKNTLIFSFENIKYYNQLFTQIGFNPYSFKCFNELKKIPMLDKQTVRAQLTNLLNTNVNRKQTRYVSTGGSTGEPLGFYLNKDLSVKEWAFMTNQWHRVGYILKDKRVIIRGYVTKENNNQLYRFNSLRNELIISSFHLTEENINFFLQLINEYQPQYIHCYPSSIYLLAKFIKNNKFPKVPKLKAILAGSENVYFDQRKLVEEVFKCRYYSWYGHSEKILLGGECEHSSYYHLYPQYGYMELVDFNGNHVTEEGQMGEIIGTSFLNTVMPFIRYKTGDIGVYTKEKCRCGRNYQLLKRVEGRLHEYIIGKDGNAISFTALNMHSDVYDAVIQYQFYQEKKGEVVLRIVKAPNYTERDTERILSELYKKVNNQVDLTIQFVPEIQLTKIGKFKTIEQKLVI